MSATIPDCLSFALKSTDWSVKFYISAVGFLASNFGCGPGLEILDKKSPREAWCVTGPVGAVIDGSSNISNGFGKFSPSSEAGFPEFGLSSNPLKISSKKLEKGFLNSLEVSKSSSSELYFLLFSKSVIFF